MIKDLKISRCCSNAELCQECHRLIALSKTVCSRLIHTSISRQYCGNIDPLNQQWISVFINCNVYQVALSTVVNSNLVENVVEMQCRTSFIRHMWETMKIQTEWLTLDWRVSQCEARQDWQRYEHVAFSTYLGKTGTVQTSFISNNTTAYT